MKYAAVNRDKNAEDFMMAIKGVCMSFTGNLSPMHQLAILARMCGEGAAFLQHTHKIHTREDFEQMIQDNFMLGYDDMDPKKTIELMKADPGSISRGADELREYMRKLYGSS